MVLVYTGMEQLDKTLTAKIPDSKLILYPDFLLQEEGETVVLSPHINVSLPFKDFLFALRQQDKRVILIVGDRNSQYIGYALALGIYDIIFDPVDEEKIIKIINNPAKFSDVQNLYLGLKETISFSGQPEKENIKDNKKETEDKRYIQSANASSEKLNDEEKEKIIRQIEGIMKFLNKRLKSNNINEMLVELEDEIIKLLL
jgi:hypothetical protein